MAYDPFLTTQSLAGVVERVSSTPPPPIELTYTRTTAPTTTSSGSGKLTFTTVANWRSVLDFMTPTVFNDNGGGQTLPEKRNAVIGRKMPVIINQSLYPLFNVDSFYSAYLVSTGNYSMFLEVTYGLADAAPTNKTWLISDITLDSSLGASACYMTVFLPKTGTLTVVS